MVMLFACASQFKKRCQVMELESFHDIGSTSILDILKRIQANILPKDIRMETIN